MRESKGRKNTLLKGLRVRKGECNRDKWKYNRYKHRLLQKIIEIEREKGRESLRESNARKKDITM